MIEIKDMFVTIKDIKYIKHIQHYGCHCLVIRYMFNDSDVAIDVDGYDEYLELANKIKDAVNGSEV